MTTQSDQKSITELLGIMSDVSCSYAVWRELTDECNRGHYEHTKNRFEDFFVTIDRSNFTTVVTGLYMLLESTDKTENLQAVLKKQKGTNAAQDHVIERWLADVASWRDLTTKIFILRSNILAHRGAKATSSDYASRANITPDQIGNLVSKIELLLKDVSLQVFSRDIDFSNASSSRSSTQQLMQTLSKSIDPAC